MQPKVVRRSVRGWSGRPTFPSAARVELRVGRHLRSHLPFHGYVFVCVLRLRFSCARVKREPGGRCRGTRSGRSSGFATFQKGPPPYLRGFFRHEIPNVSPSRVLVSGGLGRHAATVRTRRRKCDRTLLPLYDWRESTDVLSVLLHSTVGFRRCLLS